MKETAINTVHESLCYIGYYLELGKTWNGGLKIRYNNIAVLISWFWWLWTAYVDELSVGNIQWSIF